jgi:YpzG-like protein
MDTNRSSLSKKHRSEFLGAWGKPKHSFRQVNGETQQTQSLIILEHETRKRS